MNRARPLGRLWALGLITGLLAVACGDPAPGGEVAAQAASTVTPASTTAVTSTTTVDLPASTRPPSRGPVTAEDPLRVAFLGDSVAFDALKGVVAALTATGVVEVGDVRTAFGGVGLNPDAPRPALRAADEIAIGPEVDLIVVLVGSWDHLYLNRAGPDVYTNLVRELAAMLAVEAEQIIWVGEPRSDPTFGEDELQQGVNEAFRAVAGAVEGIDYVDLDATFAPDGAYARYLDGPAGEDLVARKADGRHICPAGAAIVGGQVLAAATERWGLPAPAPGWAVGDWWADPRYDTPPGICSD